MPLKLSHLKKGYTVRIYRANCRMEFITETGLHAETMAIVLYNNLGDCYKAQVFNHKSKKIFELI
jgi:hypothetical protein